LLNTLDKGKNKMGNLLDVISVECSVCDSAGFVFYGDEGMMVMPCECEE